MSKETDILSFLREDCAAEAIKPKEMVPCVKCSCLFELVDSVVQWRCPPCQGLFRADGSIEEDDQEDDGV